MSQEKLPKKLMDCWICPECGWQNPYPTTMLMSYPPSTPYHCCHCAYFYNKREELSPVEKFWLNYPEGRGPAPTQSAIEEAKK